MQEIAYTITDENGIHARPAGMFVKMASGFSSDIQVKKGERSADAKRLFGLMGLGVKRGDTIIVTVDGPDEQQAANELESFLKTNL